MLQYKRRDEMLTASGAGWWVHIETLAASGECTCDHVPAADVLRKRLLAECWAIQRADGEP